MFQRVFLVAAFAVGFSSFAKAQQARTVATCGAESLRVGDSTGLFVNSAGRQCTDDGSGGTQTGSVTSAGTSGSQAQAVQGINGGVPQNVQGTTNGTPLNTYPCQYKSALPTLSPDQVSYVTCDVFGRIQAVLGSSTALIGHAVPVSTATPIGPTPVVSTTSTLVAKASGANFYGFSVTAGATASFIAVLNASTAPAGGAAIAPLECIPVPINGYVARRQDIPDRYATGLVLLSTSSCTTYTAVTPTLMTAVVQ